jgi:hypothetical protein
MILGEQREYETRQQKNSWLQQHPAGFVQWDHPDYAAVLVGFEPKLLECCTEYQRSPHIDQLEFLNCGSVTAASLTLNAVRMADNRHGVASS